MAQQDERTGRARVVVVAGPSGSGKSRRAARLHGRFGWPVVRLDDFYRDGDEPDLPRSPLGLPDWDDPRSWDGAGALAALRALVEDGWAQVPTYDIAASARVGSHVQRCGRDDLVIAEGLFAAELIEPLRRSGLLHSAYCVGRGRWTTFLRRLSRDLREHRKPPLVLLRRGLALARREPAIVAAIVARGARPMSPTAAERELAARRSASLPHERRVAGRPRSSLLVGDPLEPSADGPEGGREGSRGDVGQVGVKSDEKAGNSSP